MAAGLDRLREAAAALGLRFLGDRLEFLTLRSSEDWVSPQGGWLWAGAEPGLVVPDPEEGCLRAGRKGRSAMLGKPQPVQQRRRNAPGGLKHRHPLRGRAAGGLEAERSKPEAPRKQPGTALAPPAPEPREAARAVPKWGAQPGAGTRGRLGRPAGAEPAT